MTLFLLALAASVGGAANALAGGGQFIIFPALLFAGIASVKANATASLVVLPGGIAAAWVYRRRVAEQPRSLILQLAAVSIAGAIVGSWLLLNTPNATFSSLVPWLLLIAATVFTAAPHLHKVAAKAAGRRSMLALLFGQFVIAIYGGYFGAGMGVLMIALFLFTANLSVQSGNGVRLICGTAINIFAVALFAIRGAIEWKAGIPMLLAGMAGGYLSARVVGRLSERSARTAILIYAWGLTIWFFVRH